ncbi:hypothetical protein GCM10011380_01550 [Sphingomonas metalli]|uniref:DUF1178 family protein n=1 Tax=Sphingomonas metalli TaxID=1779358 RepID=A0A916STD6_9SPHN|nr:DUF1178 family protein [Sphingomonas metalli]GGB15772.1 hypothetical protein GCM10011380_01550 [Sphingomonas metalli]
MIVFDLRCTAGHVFEAWFASSTAFDEQREAGRLICPLCGSSEVAKAVMAPAVAAKGNRADDRPAADRRAAIRELAAKQAALLEHSEWVGSAFATRARAMHLGQEAQATIHGQASPAEAKALVEEGVPILPLPLPVTPPEQLN